MNLFIKNMSTLRCIYFVEQQLDKLNIIYKDVKMGEVEMENDIPAELLVKLEVALNTLDLYIIKNRRSLLSEKIKQIIIDMFRHIDDEFPTENYSAYISKKLSHNYTYLANIFSESEGITIEHFIIQVKIEKVKQMLLGDDLSLSQIAYQLNYSSVAHLSSQFKKVTGITASQYKQEKEKLHT